MQAINTDPIQAAKNLRFLVTAEVISSKTLRDRLAKTLPAIQYQRGPAMAAAVPGTECQLPSNARPGLKIEWLNIECTFWFPANDGFAGKPKQEKIETGKLIDRYGGPGGTFLSPEGIPYPQRALPYEQSKMSYHRYQVEKPLTAATGPIAGWFDQPGGGVQYKTSKPVQQLIDEGVLKELPAKP
jgi:Tuberculosis necrotizing toxin